MKKVLLLNFLFLFALLGQVTAQSRTITGKVTGAGDGAPLPGVSVVVKGTTTGTATNADGTFSVNVPANATTLVFRYIGYVAQEVAIGANTSINVTLEMDSNQLSEVVIQVPYGTVAKTAFTGAESTITTRAIERQQVTSVTRVLEGLVPGIQTTNGGGTPGSNASVRIRGIGSINSSNEPLYVVDGVPFDGTLQSISTDDIASVTVLKDAAAAALYGARAANGVIMITTKRGKTGKPSIAVNLRRGVSDRAIKEYERVNEQEYYELMWEAMRNAKLGGAPQPGQDLTAANQFASDNIAGGNGLVYNPFNVAGNQVIDPATGRLNPNARLLYSDSWSDVLFQQSNRTDVNMNVSGGAEKSDYYLSVGYIKEDGIAKFSGYDRVNARASINTQITDWLKSGINIAGNMSENQGNYATGTATSNPFYYSRYMGPIYPVWQRDGEGNFVIDPVRGGNALDWGNANQMGARPYAPNSNLLGTLALDENSMRRSEATVNTFAEVKFLEDFTFKTTFGGNYYNGFSTGYQNSQFGDAANVAGRSTKADRRTTSYTFNQVLTWNKQFGEHSLRALAGHENYDYETRSVTATRTGFAFPGTTELASAATITGGNSTYANHRIESYFSQLNYSLSDKYMASASFRRDGTSRFHKDSRWGNFYSIGAGWRISEEDFLSAEWVDELKLRGSYGEQGNENTGTEDNDYYRWQGLYSLGWNNVNAPGAIVTSLPATELVWESNANFNIGADFRFFNKLEGTVEYFQRISSNLLFAIPLPYSTGGLDKWENIGTMSNNGWELQLGYNAVSTGDFDWRMDVNLTSYKNKITKMPNGDPIISGTKRLAEGKDIYAFWLREYYGVDPNNGDALYRTDHTLYKPDNAAYQIIGQDTVTNAINNATYAYQGSAIPDLIGGFTNSFRYKGFDLSFLMTFQVGGKFYDSNYGSLMHRGTYGTHFSKDMLNRWTPENTNTDVPRLQQGLATQDGASTRWLFDASYLNIKNINFGYTLPNTLTSRVGVNNMRAFVSVDNAKIFTKNEGMDPQRSFTGTSDFTYPVMRTFTLGLNANF